MNRPYSVSKAIVLGLSLMMALGCLGSTAPARPVPASMYAVQTADNGRLLGTVSSADGVISGANVEVTDNQSGRKYTAVSDADGGFTFPQLLAGTFTVKVSAQGFKTYTTPDVKIDVGKEYSLKVLLEVGNISETITVNAGAEIINATGGDLSNTVETRMIQELPLNGRNPIALVGLQAGTSQNGAQVTTINGQRASFTNITRDGINIQDNFIRSNAVDFQPDRPNVDDVEEFTITTQNAGAELGAGASQIQLVTKRGTNHYHGGVFEYNRNSEFTANTFFNNSAGVAKPFLNRNQFGGSFGGPILKDKLFFFASTEIFKLRQSTSALRTILLPQARSGLFTYIDNSDPNHPVTRTANILQLAGVAADPTVQSRLLANVPTAGNTSNAGDGLNTTGFLLNRLQNTNREAVSSRADYQITQKQSLSAVFTYRHEFNMRPDVDGQPGGAAAGYTVTPFGNQDANTYFLTFSHLWSIRGNLTNEIRAGGQKSDPKFDRTNEATDFFIQTPLISNPVSAFQKQGRNTTILNFQDNLVWLKGSHSLRLGGQAQVYRVNPYGPGAFGASTIPTLVLATNTATPSLTASQLHGISQTQLTTANNMLALLGGIIGSGNLTFNATSQTSGYVAGAQPNHNLSWEVYSGYFTDQWRVTPRLTLNLGLRYDFYTPVREPNGLALEPVVPIGSTAAAALLNPGGSYNFVGTSSGGHNFFKPDRGDFGPILSFAYSPQFGSKWLSKLFPGDGKSVIRGGFRIDYVNDEYVRSADNALGNDAGLAQTLTLSTLNARFNSQPSFPAPAFVVPRSYAQNNAIAGNFGAVFGIDPNIKVPKAYEYNFGIERQIGWQTALEVRYVGGFSHNLLRAIDLNQVNIISNGFLDDFNRALANLNLTGNPGCTTAGCQTLTVFPKLQAGGLLSNGTIRSLIASGQAGQLAATYITSGFGGASQLFLANPNTGVVDLLNNSASYTYNSFQTELRHRFSNGLVLQANYTFQKTLTDAGGVSQTRTDVLLDNNQPGLEYSRALFDQTHVFNVNLLYDLPFGSGKRFLSQSGLLDRLVGGFTVTSIMRVSSGAPLEISDPSGTLNRTARSTEQTALTSLSTSQIKNLIGIFNTPCGIYYINPAVIDINMQTCQGSGRASKGFGTTPFPGQVFFNNGPGQTSPLDRFFINGPRYFDWDASIIKNIRIKENKQLQLRIEAFNLLNHTNFCVNCQTGATTQTGIFNINSATFGKIAETFQPRIIQLVGRFNF
jgi:hypothetical protein